jgi:hypothetical protein
MFCLEQYLASCAPVPSETLAFCQMFEFNWSWKWKASNNFSKTTQYKISWESFQHHFGLKFQVFCGILPSRLLNVFRRFGIWLCFILRVKWSSQFLLDWLTLKMKSLRPLNSLVTYTNWYGWTSQETRIFRNTTARIPFLSRVSNCLTSNRMVEERTQHYCHFWAPCGDADCVNVG